MIRRYLIVLILCIFTYLILIPLTIAASTGTASFNIEELTGPTSTVPIEKTYEVNLGSGVSADQVNLDTVSYTGKGSLVSKWVSAGRLFVRIHANEETRPSFDVIGVDRTNNNEPFVSSVGNSIWLYSDGVRWQINEYSEAQKGLASYDINGVNDGGYLKPAKDGSLIVTTYSQPQIPDSWKITWLNNGTECRPCNVTNIRVDPNSVEKGDPYTYDFKWSEDRYVVQHNLHHVRYRFETAGKPTADIVEGRNYYTNLKYRLIAKTLPETIRTYRGTVNYSYTIPDQPYIKTVAEATPSAKTYNGSNTSVSVKVTGVLFNQADLNKIDYWKFYARTKDNSQYFEYEMPAASSKVKTASYTFTGFVIPASKGSNYTEEFVTRARVYFKDGTEVSAPADASTIILPSAPPQSNPAPSNEPPIAKISAPSFVKAGDNVSISGKSSYDPDGTIEDYSWTSPGIYLANLGYTITGDSGTVWYPEQGTYPIELTVTDNKGATGYAADSIRVGPPTPEAHITITGTPKENRKITLDSSGSKSPAHYPIDQTKTVWTITPISGGTASDIKYLGGLTGVQSKDILIRRAGDYKVTLTVTNRAGLSDRTETTLKVQPDFKPVADYDGAQVNYRNPSDGNKATFTFHDNSYSPDGDPIVRRKWYVIYDANNNGNFNDDGAKILFNDGNNTQVSYQTTQVGKYLFDLEVVEEFGQPTIPDFVSPADRKIANTWE